MVILSPLTSVSNHNIQYEAKYDQPNVCAELFLEDAQGVRNAVRVMTQMTHGASSPVERVQYVQRKFIC